MKNLIALLVISIFVLIAMWSLITNKFYTSHDGFTHTARIAAYYDTLKSGQMPPRWANNLNGNLGSPIFTYSYPIPYIVGAALHQVKVEYEDAFRIIIVASYLLSGLTAYFWLKNKFGVFPGIVGSVFYMWMPYRFLNIYVRGAIAENLAHAFLPLSLLAIDKIFKGSRIHLWFVIMTLSLALMLLSHNVVSAIFLPVFVLYGLVQFIVTRKRKPLAIGLLSIVVAFLLSAWIYLPDLFELSYVRFSQGISYYSDHFVYLNQLIYSPWGYGFDLPGFQNDALSFQLGLANLLLLVMFSVVFFLKKGFRNPQILFFIGLFLSLIFLITFHPLSRPIWQALPVMKSIIDFPWRFLGLMPLIFAFFAAYTVKGYRLLGIVLLVAIFVANRNHLRINEIVTFGDNTYDTYTGSATATSNEYTPAWHLSNSGFPQSTPKVAVISGDAKVTIKESDASHLIFTAVATQPATLRINRFFFPETKITGGNWEIIKNRTKIGGQEDFDDTGTIRLFVEPPGGTYTLEFSETHLRRLANLLSLATLIALIAFYARKQQIR